jgi:hypothetical protein
MTPNIANIRLIYLLLILCFGFGRTPAQIDPRRTPDPFAADASIQLDNQTIVDGIALLSQSTHVPFAVELPLGRSMSEPAPSLQKIKTVLGPMSLRETMDRLCQLDSTFAWKQIGDTANVFPRALENDARYFPNLKISNLTFDASTDAEQAVFTVAAAAHGDNQIAVLQTGISINFARPWTASFQNISVREALDKIARQLGPTYGWQFGGSAEFRVITFHERLSVKGPSKSSAR